MRPNYKKTKGYLAAIDEQVKKNQEASLSGVKALEESTTKSRKKKSSRLNQAKTNFVTHSDIQTREQIITDVLDHVEQGHSL